MMERWTATHNRPARCVAVLEGSRLVFIEEARVIFDRFWG